MTAASGETSQPGRPLLALLVVVLVFFLLHLGIVAPMSGPLIYPDELGYWYHARQLLGRAPTIDPFIGATLNKYHPGYSLLLLPSVLVSDAPAVQYKTALVLNSAVLSLMPVLLYELARIVLPKLPRWQKLAAACVIGLYPAYVLHAALTMAEVVIPVLVCGLALSAHRVLVQNTLRGWFALGAASGLLFFVHRRMLAVSLAVVLCAALWRGRRRFEPLLAAAVGAGLGLVLAYAGVRWLFAPAPAQGAAIHTGALLSSFAAIPQQPSTIFAVFAVVCGQLFYLTTATCGLFLIGLWRGFVALGRVAWGRSREGLEGLAALSVLLLIVAIPVHALFLRTRLQLNFLLNGRYNEALVAPVLLLGLAWMVERRRSYRQLGAVLGAVSVVTGVCYGVIQFRSGGRLLSLINEPVENLVLHPFLLAPWEGQSLVVLQVLAAVVLAGLLVTWRGVGRAVPLAGLSVLALFFGAVTRHVSQSYLARGSVERFHERTMVPFLQQVARSRPKITVAVDRALLGRWDWGWHAYNYVFFASCDYQTFRFDEGVPEASVLITRRPDVARFAPGALLAGYEPGPTVMTWVLDDEEGAKLRRRWPTLPADHVLAQMRDGTGKVFRPLPFNTKNVHADNGWTSGESAICFLGYTPVPEDRQLELRTHGMRLRRGPVPVTVAVDGTVLALSHTAGSSYFFALPPGQGMIDEVRIFSSTFAPMAEGDRDHRSLGIDVAAVAFVAAEGG